MTYGPGPDTPSPLNRVSGLRDTPKTVQIDSFRFLSGVALTSSKDTTVSGRAPGSRECPIHTTERRETRPAESQTSTSQITPWLGQSVPGPSESSTDPRESPSSVALDGSPEPVCTRVLDPPFDRFSTPSRSVESPPHTDASGPGSEHGRRDRLSTLLPTVARTRARQKDSGPDTLKCPLSEKSSVVLGSDVGTTARCAVRTSD